MPYTGPTSYHAQSMHRQRWRTEKLAPPAAPVKLLMPLRVTSEEICLQARAMELMTVASSLSILPACSSCSQYPCVGCAEAGEESVRDLASTPVGLVQLLSMQKNAAAACQSGQLSVQARRQQTNSQTVQLLTLRSQVVSVDSWYSLCAVPLLGACVAAACKPDAGFSSSLKLSWLPFLANQVPRSWRTSGCT